MSHTQHTPGPWLARRIDSQQWAIDAPNGDPTLKYGEWRGLADVYGCDENHIPGSQVAEANAHLIAAAPELYEALEILAAYPLEEFAKENKPDDQPLFGANNWRLTVGQVRAARKALAKARGEP